MRHGTNMLKNDLKKRKDKKINSTLYIALFIYNLYLLYKLIENTLFGF